MRIHFEIREKLPEIIEEILNCERWTTLVKEDISGRKLVVIRDPNYNSEATVEIYAREITIKTAWSNYTYRLFVSGRSEALLPLSPLRTVLDSFPSYGSSISKFNSHKLNRLNSLSLRSCS